MAEPLLTPLPVANEQVEKPRGNFGRRHPAFYAWKSFNNPGTYSEGWGRRMFSGICLRPSTDKITEPRDAALRLRFRCQIASSEHIGQPLRMGIRCRKQGGGTATCYRGYGGTSYDSAESSGVGFHKVAAPPPVCACQCLRATTVSPLASMAFQYFRYAAVGYISSILPRYTTNRRGIQLLPVLESFPFVYLSYHCQYLNHD